MSAYEDVIASFQQFVNVFLFPNISCTSPSKADPHLEVVRVRKQPSRGLPAEAIGGEGQ
jgi:hypothetical protein